MPIYDPDNISFTAPPNFSDVEYEVCPYCLVAGVERKTKLVCPTCGLILANCCGD